MAREHGGPPGARLERLLETERFIARQQARLRDAVEHLPLPTVFTDERLVVRDANVSAAELLHVDPDVLRGRLLISFVSRQDTRRFREFARPLWSGLDDHPRAIVVRVRPRGGRPCATELTVRSVGDARSNGELCWMLHPVDGASASLAH